MSDPIAEADQAAEQAKRVALVVSAYFKEMVRRGLQRTEAVDLAIGYQAELFENGRHDAA